MGEQFPGHRHHQEPQVTGNSPEMAPEGLEGGDQYWQKVDYLGNIIFDEEVTEGIAGIQKRLLSSAPHTPGRRPFESVDVLPGVKSSLSGEARERTGDKIREAESALGDEENDNDIAKRLRGVVTHVKGDLFGPDGKSAGPDAAIYVEGHEPSSGLEAFISEEDGVEISAEDMPKVEAVMSVLLASGQYKLLKWNNGRILDTSLRLLEDMTAVHPDFSPDKAGAGDLVDRLSKAAAATRVELSSKPNYQYAKPEIGALSNQLSNALRSISRVKAEVILRTHDFELPPTEQPTSVN